MSLIKFHAAGSGIPACFLLLVEPFWNDKPRLRIDLKSEQVEGRTGIETRQPEHLGPRHTLRYTLTLTEAEAGAWHDMLAVLGDNRVAVPMWLDFYSAPADWLLSAQKVISWNSAGNYQVTAPSGSYAYPQAAPLLIGRLKERRPLQPAGEGFWEVDIDVEEDSPWDCRLQPAMATPGAWEWEPDWTEVSTVSRDQLKRLDVGAGREQPVAGGEGTPRWGQEAGFVFFSRAEIGRFLSYWVAQQGSVKAFPVPLWVHPGSPTTQTPANITARFDKDFIELTFDSQNVATTKIKLWQEVSLQVGQGSQSGDAVAYGYRFLWEGAPSEYLTSWEKDLTWQSATYLAGQIEHSGLRLTMTPWGDEVTVSIFEKALINPLMPIARGDAERRLRLQIMRFGVAANGTVSRAEEIFFGEIKSAELSGGFVKGTAIAFGYAFRRKVPRYYVQSRCNYVLGDPCCGLSKASLAKTGTLGSSGYPSSSVSFTPAAAPAGGYAAKWFAQGWLEVTASDGSLHRRAVLDCTQSGSVWTLKLNRWLPATCAGRTASVMPGCDGNYSTCKAKFSNGLQFGGEPFVPSFIATSSGRGGGGSAK